MVKDIRRHYPHYWGWGWFSKNKVDTGLQNRHSEQWPRDVKAFMGMIIARHSKQRSYSVWFWNVRDFTTRLRDCT